MDRALNLSNDDATSCISDDDETQPRSCPGSILRGNVMLCEQPSAHILLLELEMGLYPVALRLQWDKLHKNQNILQVRINTAS
jgi:hypothetical protein